MRHGIPRRNRCVCRNGAHTHPTDRSRTAPVRCPARPAAAPQVRVCAIQAIADVVPCGTSILADDVLPLLRKNLHDRQGPVGQLGLLGTPLYPVSTPAPLARVLVPQTYPAPRSPEEGAPALSAGLVRMQCE